MNSFVLFYRHRHTSTQTQTSMLNFRYRFLFSAENFCSFCSIIISTLRFINLLDLYTVSFSLSVYHSIVFHVFIFYFLILFISDLNHGIKLRNLCWVYNCVRELQDLLGHCLNKHIIKKKKLLQLPMCACWIWSWIIINLPVTCNKVLRTWIKKKRYSTRKYVDFTRKKIQLVKRA